MTLHDLGQWWTNPTNIADLGRWLSEQGRTPEDVWYFVEKAHKWEPEYEEMLREDAQERMLAESCFEDDLQRRSAL